VDCEISSRLRKALEYPIAAPTSRRHRVLNVRKIRVVDPVAIGDVVEFLSAGDETGIITRVLPRRNHIARQDPGPRPIEVVIASNLDYMVQVVAAAEPPPKWELVDRYLASAEKAEIPSLIVLTKCDLLRDASVEREAENYRKIGYPVLLTSSAAGQGIVELQAALHDKLAVFVGMSGVGKSSLLNALQPELALRVNQISLSTGKGKHTTTHLEMFDLDFGGRIVDTPGLKYLTLWDIEPDELADYMPEFRPFLGKCKFGADCSHEHEPHCAVKAAVEHGDISERRYKSYLRIKEKIN
jgi:ribosome biogenesis GTPase